MSNKWFRNFVVLVFAGLVLAGCAGTGPQREPTEPAAEPTETPDTTPAPAAEAEETPEFDEAGNPFVPGSSSRLLPRTFYFDYDQSVLDPEDLAALEMHATILRNNPEREVIIEGHADERGTREYNLALGERRAEAVESFLESSGVDSRQIEIVSYGEERPEDSGHDEEAWSRNRRAVMIYR